MDTSPLHCVEPSSKSFSGGERVFSRFAPAQCRIKRCSLREWIPILPWPVWPLAGQFLLGQNVVVGSMTILLAVRGNIATRSMSGPLFSLQLHRTTVWCRATIYPYSDI